MADDRIEVVDSRSAWMTAAFDLRHEVFVLEQNVPPHLERDALDDGAVHLVAVRDDVVVGTLRIVMVGRTAKVGRMAVRAALRRSGIGRRLMWHAMAVAAHLGATDVALHAQLAARDFYRRLGFQEEGPVFAEAGIPHVAMRKQIA